MKIIAFLIISLLMLAAHAQDSTSRFAIVNLGEINNRYICTVKYSNDKEYDMIKALGLNVKDGHIVTDDEIVFAEFRVLNYFYDKKYELQSVCKLKFSKQFYFKRRD